MYLVEQAKPSDSHAVWEIRYHPLVNRWANNTEAADFFAHDQWFQEKYFGQSQNKCFVLRADGQTAGYCRFDLNEASQFIVSLAIDPNYHGQGLGQRLISESLELLPLGSKVLATVKRQNQVSLHLLQKNGFIIEQEDQAGYGLSKSI